MIVLSAVFIAIIAKASSGHPSVEWDAWDEVMRNRYYAGHAVEAARSRVTVQGEILMPEPIITTPYIRLYANWGVRKGEDGRYFVLPIIEGAPRWEAAIETAFEDPVEAWDAANDLTRQHAIGQGPA